MNPIHVRRPRSRRSRLRPAAFLFATILSPGMVRSLAATVTVLDASHQPRAGAIVACVDSGPPMVQTAGPEGVTPPLSDRCRFVTCTDPQDSTLCGTAVLSEPNVTCTLEARVRIRVELPAGSCPQGCRATLLRSGKGVSKLDGLPATVACVDADEVQVDIPPEKTLSPTPPAAGPATGPASGASAPARPPGSDAHPAQPPLTISFPLVRPGRFQLRIDRPSDGWRCRADLGTLRSARDPVAVTVAWREPVRLEGGVRRSHAAICTTKRKRRAPAAPRIKSRIVLFRPRWALCPKS